MHNGFEFDSRIVNKGLGGPVHIAFRNKVNLDKAKSTFPNIYKTFNSDRLFCRRGPLSSGYKRTENPELATCEECLKVAEEWKYGPSYIEDSLTISLSSRTLNNILNWIPDSCEIVIGRNKVRVLDSVTKEDLEVQNVNQAAMLIVDKCFEPMSAEFISNNQLIFSKNIFGSNNELYSVQGLNYNNELNSFDGLILKSKNGNLRNSFVSLLKGGYSFEDGTPIASITEDRKPLTESEIKETLGILSLESETPKSKKGNRNKSEEVQDDSPDDLVIF